MEAVKPIPVTSPGRAPIRFWLRCQLDLQLKTITAFLRPTLAPLRGALLDVGAGQSPWRDLLPPGVTYQGVDVALAGDFGMDPQPDVILYEGEVLPVADAAFDVALCVEVLEHSPRPGTLIREIHRALKPGGLLVLTVPWSARRHHVPHDYHRFTREGLDLLLREAGFVDVAIAERGDNVAVLANKLLVLAVEMLRPVASPAVLWRVPLGVWCAAQLPAFLAAAHLTMALGRGPVEDPLGYAVTARRQPA